MRVYVYRSPTGALAINLNRGGDYRHCSWIVKTYSGALCPTNPVVNYHGAVYCVALVCSIGVRQNVRRVGRRLRRTPFVARLGCWTRLYFGIFQNDDIFRGVNVFANTYTIFGRWNFVCVGFFYVFEAFFRLFLAIPRKHCSCTFERVTLSKKEQKLYCFF